MLVKIMTSPFPLYSPATPKLKLIALDPIPAMATLRPRLRPALTISALIIKKTMMMLLLLSPISSTVQAANFQIPVEVPFNDSATAGPDGPWNFLSVSVSSNVTSRVDFYPMIGETESLLVTVEDCESNKNECLFPSGEGYYTSDLINGSTDTTPDGQHLAEVTSNVTGWSNFYTPIHNFTGTGRYTLRDFNMSSPIAYDDIAVYVSSDLRANVGSLGYRPLSLLSMATANADQNKSQLVGGGTANSTIVADVNTKNGLANSFALHYGAAGFGQKGSMYMGGYDAKRLIEEPINAASGENFNLRNITITTSSGDSPWTGTGRAQPEGNLAGNPINGVHVLPQVPYLYLDQNTVQSLLSHLPIYRDGATQMFLWNTTDPLYDRLMTSPTFLTFTFDGSPSGSIRVPFATLSLNLTSPLKDTPTPYFPVWQSDDIITLGRAFLQSTFYMKAFWSSAGTLSVAQAPGPSIGGPNDTSSPNLVACDPALPAIKQPSSPPTLEDTWAGILQPLGPQELDSSASSHAALPAGSIAAIVICVILFLAGAGMATFCLTRRRRLQRQRRHQEAILLQVQREKQDATSSVPSSTVASSWTGPPVEAPGTPCVEVPENAYVEVDGSGRAELQGSEAEVCMAER